MLLASRISRVLCLDIDERTINRGNRQPSYEHVAVGLTFILSGHVGANGDASKRDCSIPVHCTVDLFIQDRLSFSPRPQQDLLDRLVLQRVVSVERSITHLYASIKGDLDIRLVFIGLQRQKQSNHPNAFLLIVREGVVGLGTRDGGRSASISTAFVLEVVVNFVKLVKGLVPISPQIDRYGYSCGLVSTFAAKRVLCERITKHCW